MTNKASLLEQAHTLFSTKEYHKALFLYAQLLSYEPTNQEYQLYALFCDIASEDTEKGQALFDYFTVAKEEDFDEAVTYVMDTISAYDGDNDKMMDVLQEFSAQTVESLDAIEYKDFEKLVENRGSFKIAFQDIMFSTKVAITTKDEFFTFVEQLIENNFEKTAYSYLDGFTEYFKYDTKILELYNRLGKSSVELKDK